jgi:hypothetical protein
MCVVSMVGDHYREKWKPRFPDWDDVQIPVWPSPKTNGSPTFVPLPPEITRAEFDALKKEVEEMKGLLKRAKEYDERNGEPDCEIDEKMSLLRKVAAAVGISLDDVIGKPT